jgi:hypothetical protein
MLMYLARVHHASVMNEEDCLRRGLPVVAPVSSTWQQRPEVDGEVVVVGIPPL